MKNTFKGLLLLSFCLLAYTLKAQKSHLKIEIENISIKTPEGWKPQKSKENTGEFSILLNNNKDNNEVSIHCIKKTMNLEAAIINQSSKTSLRPGFEDMIIEKVKTKELNKKFKGKFLEFTNSPLRNYYRGGYYGIVNKGYTYIIEYYSSDLPEDRILIENILSSINILAPESRPNFFLIEKEFLPEDVSLPELKEQDIDMEIVDTNLSKKELRRLEKRSKKAKKDHFDIVIQEEEERARIEQEKLESREDTQIATLKEKTKSEIKAEKKAEKKRKKLEKREKRRLEKELKKSTKETEKSLIKNKGNQNKEKKK